MMNSKPINEEINTVVTIVEEDLDVSVRVSSLWISAVCVWFF